VSVFLLVDAQPLSAMARNEALYALEMPESTAESLVVLWVNVLVSEETRVRFGSPYISQLSRETAYVDLQKLLLKEMATILRPGVLVSEQKVSEFKMHPAFFILRLTLNYYVID
jgi:hypothetical protein